MLRRVRDELGRQPARDRARPAPARPDLRPHDRPRPRPGGGRGHARRSDRTSRRGGVVPRDRRGRHHPIRCTDSRLTLRVRPGTKGPVDDHDRRQDGERDASPPPPPWQKGLKRYGPIVAVVALIAGAVVIFGGGGGDDDDGGSGGSTEVGVERGPHPLGADDPREGRAAGRGGRLRADAATPSLGRIMLKSVYAPPCVEPFEGDNGGATSPGVTADAVKVVFYRADPALDPLTAATIEGAGADMDPEIGGRHGAGVRRPVQPAVRDLRPHGRGRGLHRHRRRRRHRRRPGRRHRHRREGPVRGHRRAQPGLQRLRAPSSPRAASSAARPARWRRPRAWSRRTSRYLWGLGPTPDQGAALASEAIGNLAGPGPAELAGDEAMQYRGPQVRPAALRERRRRLRRGLPGLPGRAGGQRHRPGASTSSSPSTWPGPRRTPAPTSPSCREAGITTIIYTGDPLTPGYAHRGGDRPGLLPRVDPGAPAC